ncbi:MAG: serine/threonine-protein kinase [Candidatus Solibacter sp.]
MERKVDLSLAETVASQSLMGEPLATEASDISRVTSSAFEDEGRFIPGTLLGGRYRIIGLLGRGGMGEVYRATDLTLGQSVALKFLPEEASRNQRLLERFHGEVRVARLVSHPNVCRVYDIGEIEGMPFISMEYVDGEDLASLLMRIGRLPADKAVETSRKLCAGLTAAHDRGVIHRDLKPQNIMINKRGEVVIMDFGLAAISDQLSGAEIRNGTPAYMAPEQLKGAGVTARSDIYALGLVLYELFTGRRPYDAKNLQQLIDLQDSVHLTSMISVAADIDPAVEKIIRRCLDPDPMKRPATAVAVSAALPGGDPLAAALAAGETPSPEMVAAAGTVAGMARKWAVLCLALVVVFLLVQIPIRMKRTAMFRAPLEYSPDVLAHLSRTAAQNFGYTKKPADSYLWLEHRRNVMTRLLKLPEPRKWDEWYAAEAPIYSLYRESPKPLEAPPYGEVTTTMPPPLTTGMASVLLDGNGKLRDFAAVPYPEGAATPVSPETVFHAAGFDIAGFKEAPPEDLPVRPFDQWRAWSGPHPAIPGLDVHLEIASWKGQISRATASLRDPAAVQKQAETQDSSTPLRTILIRVVQALGAFFVVLLAMRNWKLKRADVQGAWRVAMARFLLAAVTWAGDTHFSTGDSMIAYGTSAAGECLLVAAILFLVYLALEPAVRARWPHSIVTWNRVLAGRWQDPQVASDILIGAAVGTGMFTFFKGLFVLLPKQVNPVNTDINLSGMLGVRQWLGSHADTLGGDLRLGLLIFLAIFGLRRLLRNDWLAALGAAVLFTLMQGQVSLSGDGAIMIALYLIVYGALMFVLLRNGLVTTIATLFFVDSCNSVVLGTNWNTWYTPAGLASLLLLCGIATWAFNRALGARELIGEEA